MPPAGPADSDPAASSEAPASAPANAPALAGAEAEAEAMSEARDGYRVAVEAFHGPLDLLLHLVRKHEVDLFDLRVAEITDQYLEHVRTLQALDLDAAGEFLALAAQLVELKSLELLPHAHGAAYAEDAEDDPRFELVQQLIEYKRFRDLGDTLGRHHLATAQRLGMPPGRVPELPPSDDVYLDDVEVWDLFRAFASIVGETSLDVATIALDDRPISAHMDEVRAALAIGVEVEFQAMLGELARDRAALIGAFLALLELVRLKELKVRQDAAGRLWLTRHDPAEAERLRTAEGQAPPPAGNAADTEHATHGTENAGTENAGDETPDEPAPDESPDLSR